jgi:hypothetical protein
MSQLWIARAENGVGPEIGPDLCLQGGLDIDPADDAKTLFGERGFRRTYCFIEGERD